MIRELRKLFKKMSPTIGIDIGTTSIKTVELKGNLANLQLVSFQRTETPSDVNIDGQISNKEVLAKKLESIVQKNGWQGRQVVTAVGGRKAIIRHLKLPIMPEAELKQVVQFEADKYIPFGNQEVVVDYLNLGPLSDDKDQCLVLLAALPQETALAYYEVFTAAGLELVAIDLIPLALQRALGLQEQGEGIAIADIGTDTTNFSIIGDQKVSFARTIATAGNANQILSRPYTAEIAAAGELVVKKESILRPNNAIQPNQDIKECLLELVRELRRSLDFWRTQSQGKSITKLLLTGGTANLKGIGVFLGQELGMEVVIGQPLPYLASHDPLFGPEFALASGLALRGVIT